VPASRSATTKCLGLLASFPFTALWLCCSGVVDAWTLRLGRDSGVEAHVLHADDLVTFMHSDGVPDCHLVGG